MKRAYVIGRVAGFRRSMQALIDPFDNLMIAFRNANRQIDQLFASWRM